MQIEAQVIPVEGLSRVPGVAEPFDFDVQKAETRRQKRELFLLNTATALTVMLVSCAWIAIALD